MFLVFAWFISQTMMPLATLLVPLKSPQWVEVHESGFVLFKPKVQEWLNIEQFCQKKSLKSNLIFKEIGAHFAYYWKVFNEKVNWPQRDIYQIQTFKSLAFIRFKPSTHLKTWQFFRLWTKASKCNNVTSHIL